ncbi:MAG: SDR family NAD(P)-dependent oxidoreductase, partial [Myxococcota bacterium]
VVSDVEPRRLAQMVAVNLGAPIALTRMALPHLRAAAAAGGPKRFVVQVASLAGTIPIDGAATYSATKFGLRTFSFALAEELRDEPVTISVVSPGPIDTGFIMDQIEDVSDLTFSQPICTAAHVAEMVVASARDGRRERQWPESAGTMATLGYLFPGLRRMLKPVLARRGRRRKEALIAARDGQDG